MIKRLKRWLEERKTSVTFNDAVQIISEQHHFYVHHIEDQTLVMRCHGLGDVVELRRTSITIKLPLGPTVPEWSESLFIGGHAFHNLYGKRIPKRLLPHSQQD